MPAIRFVFAVALLIHATAPLANEAGYSPVRITDQVYVIFGPTDQQNRENRGFRNNVGIVLTDAGVVVIDPGGSAWAGEMVAEKIRALSRMPVIAIFNTHAHGDHWLGNEGIRRSYPEAVIYAHPVAKSRIEGPYGKGWLERVDQATEGTAGTGILVPPDKAVDDNSLIEFGSTRFHIHHAGRAHTNNDIMVEVVGQRVMFTGDVVRNGMIGIIEESGSFRGNIAAIDEILHEPLDYYIPGHGPAGGSEVPASYRGYLGALVTTVEELIGENLADFEMKPVVVEAAAEYSGWKNFDDLVGQHVSQVYLEIEASLF